MTINDAVRYAKSLILGRSTFDFARSHEVMKGLVVALSDQTSALQETACALIHKTKNPPIVDSQKCEYYATCPFRQNVAVEQTAYPPVRHARGRAERTLST